MKIVYCHERNMEMKVTGQSPTDNQTLYGEIIIAPKGGTTAAIESIQSWVINTLEPGMTIQRKVGLAKCSDEDNYNKKIGRDLAQSRMKLTTLTVIKRIEIGDFTSVIFEDDNKNLFEFKATSDQYCARFTRILNE